MSTSDEQVRASETEARPAAHERHNLSALDAVRLLCNSIQIVQHFDREEEGISLGCRDRGELMLQDALVYLAYGDMINAAGVMRLYERWLASGDAPWPYDPSKPPPSAPIKDEDDQIPF